MFFISCPSIYVNGFNPIGTILRLHILNKYFNIESLSEYKFTKLIEQSEFRTMF